MAVILALDPGERRTGIAICDPTGSLARPLLTHDRKTDGSLFELVAGLCHENSVELVLVGLPLTQMGERGPMAVQAETLAAKLRERLELPVELVDERYTSLEADRILVGRRQEKGRRDAVAAALLLQTWLERSPSPLSGDDPE
jgi:putative Holliday junction resolvase